MDSIRQLKNNLAAFSFLIFLATSISTTASENVEAVDGAEENWELAKDSGGITVYTRKVEGYKHKAVKGEMIVDGSVNALVALVRDTGACSEWADLCKEAVELKQDSANELQVYTYNNIPWPVSDRDVITNVTWSQDARTGTVSMYAEAIPDRETRKTRAVRITEAVTQWLFTPLEDGKVHVVMRARLNPGGPMPAWLTNMLLTESPIKTMEGMRALLETGRYDDVDYGFSEEPVARKLKSLPPR